MSEEISTETSSYLQFNQPEEIDHTKLCDCILRDAVTLGASDIHIEPRGQMSVIRLRIGGKLRVLEYLQVELHAKISGRFKVMCDIPTFEKGMPVEGRAAGIPGMGNVTLRISIFPLGEGEKIVIRIFDPSARSFDLEELGFSALVRDQFVELLESTGGLILLTGPTGSGKTTAIYAALAWLIQKYGDEISISTIEDPIEIPMEHLSQSQLAVHNGFTYPVALRSLMRQDPQVIMIGEIRDAETAAVAVQASLTGHLVISTIHSGSTAGVFTRMLNMGIEPFLLCSSIIAVLGMRLLPQNCGMCAAPYVPEIGEDSQLSQEILDAAEFRKGLGCNHCDFTGYGTRRGIVEMLVPDRGFREAVMRKEPDHALYQIAIDAGMKTMWEHGIRRAICGEARYEDVVRAITEEVF
ncbi:MAG: GspE/PulE family protein [Verrucomicrobiia bacterium]|jgi:type II secretory ATPase GspE/PulE/Tfp pilus assembly ATPase PilB-like protein